MPHDLVFFSVFNSFISDRFKKLHFQPQLYSLNNQNTQPATGLSTVYFLARIDCFARNSIG